ncbi:MAG: hypothetical protein KDC98_21600 [Planctomycetes bacterium]|nr:hypothetical protein [Planctomycetota bacterium]
MKTTFRSHLLALTGALMFSNPMAAQEQSRAPVLEPIPVDQLTQAGGEGGFKLVLTSADSSSRFMGVILVSFERTLKRQHDLLPPLLCDAAVLHAGYGIGSIGAVLSDKPMTAGFDVYAQGILFDKNGIRTTVVDKVQ